MADDLNTMLTDGAAFDEDRDRLAGNVQDASISDPAGSSENPGGNTGFGDATDNTITETAPESEPPAVAATQDIAEPETDVGGGSGGVALVPPPTTLATEEPVIDQAGVAQFDPTLQEIAAPVAAEEPAPEPTPEPTPEPPAPEPPAPIPPAPEPPPEEPNGPPTVFVLPSNPAAPTDSDSDLGNNDDNFNEALRSDPLIQLPPGLVSEVGLEDGLSQFATTQGTIVIGDPDGIGDIATVLIAGQLFSLSQLLTIDPLNPTFQIPLDAGDGDTETEGVLTLQSFDPVTGVISFSFTLTSPVDNANPLGNPNIDQNSAFVPISVTVTDLGGATATATGGIRIVDATPFVLASTEELPQLIVDESAGEIGTAGGSENAGGFDTVSLDVSQFFDSSADPGTQFGFGADGPGTVSYALLLNGTDIPSGLFALGTNSSQGSQILLSQASPTSAVIGSVDGVDYFEITISSTGQLSLTQLSAIWNDIPGSSFDEPVTLNLEDSDLLQVQQTVTDFDGDQASGTLNIGQGVFVFEDDGPIISVNAVTEPVLTVDETALATNVSANFAGNFTSTFGADAAGSIPITYAVGTAGGASGLVDTATNEVVNLVNNAGVIEGRTAGTNDLVFTVTVNSATGEVTLDQIRAVVHPTLDPNEPKSLSADNLVTVTATITDKDGDTQNATLNIGSNLLFLDDGPTITANGTIPTLTTDDSEIIDTAGPTSFAGVFSENFGTDDFKDSDDNDVEDLDAVTYELGVKTTGGASGLTDTLTGDAVLLSLDGSDVVGTVNGGIDEVFRISVDTNSGEVTLTQSRSVVHNDPADPAETGASAATLAAADLITLTATITDGDGDIASDSADIGLAFSFEDDGPSITSMAVSFDAEGNQVSDSTPGTVYLQVPEPLVPTGTPYTADIVNWTFGADDYGSVSVTGLTPGYSIQANGTGTSTLTSTADAISFDIWKQIPGTATWEKLAEYRLDSDGSDTVKFFPYTGSTTVTQSITASKADAGGPKPVIYVDLLQADVTVGVTSSSGLVNASSQGWAVDNQNIDPNETITFSFFDYSANKNALDAEGVQQFSFAIPKPTGGGSSSSFEPSITVAYQTGAQSFNLNLVPADSYVVVSSQGVFVYSSPTSTVVLQSYFAIDPDGGGPLTQPISTTLFTSVSIKNDGGGANFNVNGPAITTINENTTIPDLSYQLTLDIVDGDGDSSSVLMSTQVDGNDGNSFVMLAVLPEPPTVSPVSLDLDRSGSIDYLTTDDGVLMSYEAGVFASSWISGSDGLLVYDYNNDGQITEAKEFVFTMWGSDPDVATDMQALAAYFDADANGVKDGVLDANDTAWSYFGVWQDLNVDGVQDEGEFAYLVDWDITGIALSYDADSTTYAAAEGDVLVYGQMTVTYADGSTGLAEDVAFAVAHVDALVSETTVPVTDTFVQDVAIPDEQLVEAVAPVDAPVAETTVPVTDTFIQDVAIPDEQVVEAEVASVADLVEQYVGENAVTDEAIAEYQQELALTEVPVAADMAAEPAAIEPTADALAALDEADALLPDDASDGIATATDVVDDFSYTV